MPSVKYHKFRSKVKYGEEAEDIHTWIDFPVRKIGRFHRRERHDYDQELTLELIEKYGDPVRAYCHMMLHLDDDWIQEKREHGLGYRLPRELVIKTRMAHVEHDYSTNERTYKIITWEEPEGFFKSDEPIKPPLPDSFYDEGIQLIRELREIRPPYKPYNFFES